MAGKASQPATRGVTLARVFPIGREALFRAWTDPLELAKWWGPKAWTVVRCELDLRAKGRWNISFSLPGGGTRCIGGRYLEIEPPGRLVFTWEPEAANEEAEPASVVTVEFQPAPGGTELRLQHLKLTTGRAVDMDVGWNSTFESLADYANKLTAELGFQDHQNEEFRT